LKGEENVPEAAAAEPEHLGFTVRMEDPVVEMKDISPNAYVMYKKEIHKDYGFGGIFRDYLKLRVMTWKDFDRSLFLTRIRCLWSQLTTYWTALLTIS
jgi:hypothetical protein